MCNWVMHTYKKAFKISAFPVWFPGEHSWPKRLGGMSGACLGPAFKYPGQGGGHARNQTPPQPAAMYEAAI